MRLLFRLCQYGRYGHQHKAPRFQPLGPCRNARDGNRIQEGRADREYRWESRIAILTGLPSVNGWNFHQRQQRTFDPLPRLVQQRVANINAFYSTEDIASAWAILQHYDVSYVVVSRLEMAYYPSTGLSKFNDMVQQGMLKVVYQGGAATLYEVIPDAGFQMNEDARGGI